MESSILERCPLMLNQPTRQIFQMPFYQLMKNDALLGVYKMLSAFHEYVVIMNLLNISSGFEFSPIVHNLQLSLPVVGLEIVNLSFITARIVLNLTTKKCKTEVKADQNTEMDYVENCHGTAYGFGGHTCCINVKPWLENSAMNKSQGDKENDRDDESLHLVMSATISRARSVADKCHIYGEAILNTDYFIAEGKTGELENVNEEIANKKIPGVSEKNMEAETSDLRNFEYSSIQGVSTINGNDCSEPNQQLPTVPLPLCKAGVQEWKEDKCKKPKMINIKKHSKSTGKSCLTAQKWILLLYVCHFSTTTAATALSTSEPEINTTVNATIGESFSISCGVVAQYDFIWRRYIASEKRKEKLYVSLNIKNYTNTSNIFLPNGTIIFPKAKFSDMADYYCIVHKLNVETNYTDSFQHVYHVNVQNSTFKSTEVRDNVTSGNITASKGTTGIVVGVVVDVIVGGAAVAGLSYFCVRKRRKKRIERERRTHVSSNGSNQNANGIGNGVHYEAATNVETVVQGNESDTVRPLMQNGHGSV